MATKYLIFSVIFFGYAMFAYNRKGVSFAIPKLLEEGFENSQVGLILSSQNLAYAISKFLGGIISDRLSSRLLFSSGLLISGLAAILFSLVDSVLLFTLAWFLNGLAQGVGWPAIAKLLKNWFDPAELGTWWSIASASANLSGCLAPFLASHIIMNYGWRSSLMFVGGLTLVAATISFIFIVDSPSVSTPKKKSTNEGAGSKKTSKPIRKSSNESPLSMLLRTKFIIVISIYYLIISCIKTSFTDWSQMYLMSDCRQSSLVASSFVSSFEFGGFFGGIAAGSLSDLYTKSFMTMGTNIVHHKGHPRMTVAALFSVVSLMGVLSFYYLIDETTNSPIFINQLGIIIGASVYGQIAIFGVVATQSVPSEMSGTAHAIAALAANIGSVMAGLPMAWIAKHYSWSDVFYVQSIIIILMTLMMAIWKNVKYGLRASQLAVVKKTN